MMADILRGADVICSTCVGAGGSSWRAGATALTTSRYFTTRPHTACRPQGVLPLGRPRHSPHPYDCIPQSTCSFTAWSLMCSLMTTTSVHSALTPHVKFIGVKFVQQSRRPSRPALWC